MAGFLKRLKFWDADTVIRDTMDRVHRDYDEFKSQSPRRDVHHWLTATLVKSTEPDSNHGIDAAAPYNKTALFSVLDEEDAVTALAYFLISQKMPLAVPKIGKQWEALVRPANDLIIDGKFYKKWQEINPWTARNVKGVRESVQIMEDKGKKKR